MNATARPLSFAGRLAGGLVLALWLATAATHPVSAQNPADTTTSAEVENPNPYGSGLGLEILLTNNGFGLGGYYHRAIDQSASFMAEVSLGAGKDEQEMKFFRIGSSHIPYKANYLLMVPMQAGISRRLFQENIEDNFRPFFQLTAGPTIGWEYPYFDDRNGDGSYDAATERTYDAIGSLPKGNLRFGAGGTLAIGAHFGLSKRVTQGVRLGYAFTYFFEGIQLLEPQVQDAQKFFGTPSISLIFGRLF